MSEKQFSEKPWGSENMVRKSQSCTSEKPEVRKFGPKSRFRRSQEGAPTTCPKSNFRRSRGWSETLVRRAVFGEAKLVRNYVSKGVRKAIFGETGGPKIWSEKPFSKKPGWSENLSEKQFSEKPRMVRNLGPKSRFRRGQAGPKLFPKVSEKQFSEKPEVRKFGPKSRFRRSQGGPKTCPKSNFRRSRGWSQSYPEMCTETNFQRSREGLKSYSIFGEDRVVWKAMKNGRSNGSPMKTYSAKGASKSYIERENIIMFIPCMWKFGAKYIGCKGQQHVKFNKRACMDAFASCRAFHEPEHAALYSATSLGSPITADLNSASKATIVGSQLSGTWVLLLVQRYLKHEYKSASSQVSFNGNAMNNSRSVRSAGITGFLLHGTCMETYPHRACVHVYEWCACEWLYSPERSNGLHVGFSPNAKKALPKSWRIGS